jgi:hypothetical protein
MVAFSLGDHLDPTPYAVVLCEIDPSVQAYFCGGLSSPIFVKKF